MYYRPKAQVDDLIRILDEEEITALYGLDDHGILAYACEEFIVQAVTRVSGEIIHYEVVDKFNGDTLVLIDSDFRVFKNGEWVYENKPVPEVYEELPVYLCLDSSGGMSDRLCIGDQALIDNANATVEVWYNTSQGREVYLEVASVEKAIEILSEDNFEVIEIKPNTVHVANNYIITDNDINVYNDYFVFSPKGIYEKIILRSAEPKYLIDLTTALDN